MKECWCWCCIENAQVFHLLTPSSAVSNVNNAFMYGFSPRRKSSYVMFALRCAYVGRQAQETEVTEGYSLWLPAHHSNFHQIVQINNMALLGAANPNQTLCKTTLIISANLIKSIIQSYLQLRDPLGWIKLSGTAPPPSSLWDRRSGIPERSWHRHDPGTFRLVYQIITS